MMRFLPMNLDAMLVELDDLPQTLALLDSLRADPIEGLEEIVPAARTLMLRFHPTKVSHDALVERIGGRSLTARGAQHGERIEIPVVYDGEDLDEVAALLGITREEVVRRHTGCDYTVAFTGFAPGFAYLSGGDPSLDVPRRKTPRTRIPAGAVGLAGRFSGVYPQASPGGWQIIGVTPTRMWDLARETPALLQPGFRVRFVDVSGRAGATHDVRSTTAAHAQAPRESSPHEGPALEVLSAGLQALFQDLGRPGQAAQGVSASGAMDRGALRAANRLVGNAVDAPCIELAYGGFHVACRGDAVLAVAGADVPLELVGADGIRMSLANHAPIALSDGDSLRIGEPRAGIRCYVAARGGFVVAPVLGSCATDTLANVGPAPIANGDRLPIRAVTHTSVVGAAEAPSPELPTRDRIVDLDVVMGPRTDWFTPESIARFAAQSWTVTPQSNRVGLRLAAAADGAPLERARDDELPSEGTALGAIQVPPSGLPVLFLADHPLTGGYPVIAAVAPHHLDRAGQIPIGARVRFHPIRAFETQERTP